MFSLYLFALIVGGALLLFSLLGGSDQGDDLGHDGAHSSVQWLSIRTATYFLFVFGGVGAILTRTWPPAMMPVRSVVLAKPQTAQLVQFTAPPPTPRAPPRTGSGGRTRNTTRARSAC